MSEWGFILIAFFIGSIPTAYWAGKYLKNLDIRKYGSGNVGATNAFRVLGKTQGIMVLIIDFLKGFLPASLLPQFLPLGVNAPAEAAAWIGFGAILGHIFNPFLGLRGGKGVATGAGVIGAIFPWLLGLVLTVWIVSFLITRIVSISSLLAIASLSLFTVFLKQPPSSIVFFLTLFILSLWTHRENISRLISGRENKLS